MSTGWIQSTPPEPADYRLAALELAVEWGKAITETTIDKYASAEDVVATAEAFRAFLAAEDGAT